MFFRKWALDGLQRPQSQSSLKKNGLDFKHNGKISLAANLLTASVIFKTYQIFSFIRYVQLTFVDFLGEALETVMSTARRAAPTMKVGRLVASEK